MLNQVAYFQPFWVEGPSHSDTILDETLLRLSHSSSAAMAAASLIGFA